MAELSPMMQHYLQTKEEYPDCILFYRLGDFYEMFFEDAKLVSRELELTLTGKQCGLPERAPMCGVPYHAVDSYLTRLVANGHKVAICEQIEDPKTARGMVKRAVIRVVTPGTNLDMESLEELYFLHPLRRRQCRHRGGGYQYRRVSDHGAVLGPEDLGRDHPLRPFRDHLQ